ncbi:ankyrin [Nitratireductor indicus C115]|uniref:Ankyrin n=1 Tax=Nitratireductor indicus C115 TaxID=1231190 RepID=K2MX28_9HYPH|nr:ankyrin repeat domain-containing protein [Nitratireductor indicus]EKF39823.1 ankyrin [Nitratireductor indicus C115]SFQ59193.1 Ankyrin repeat-containing protein [Nitratireductor indicus]
MTRFARPLIVALVLINAAPAIAQVEAIRPESKACIAVSTDQLEDLDEAVAEGMKLPSVTCDGRSLASIAAVRASPDVLEYLAFRRVDLEGADTQGYTPIMRALQAARVDNALKLRNLGVSLEGVTDDGYTVRVLAETVGLEGFGPEPPGMDKLFTREAASEILLSAAEAGNVEVAKMALANDADVSATAPNGWSAVMIAALAGRVDIVTLLVERGALGPSDEPLRTVGEAVDAVVAALVGKGNGDMAAVDAILEMIAAHKELDAKADLYRVIAARQGYEPDFIKRHFRESDLLPPEIDLPLGSSNDSESWARLQRVLEAKGLYEGAPDGIPGEGTLSALHGYFAPMEETLLRRSITAMRRAQALYDTTGRPFGRGYGKLTLQGAEWLGQFWKMSGGLRPNGYVGRLLEVGTTDVAFGYVVMGPETSGSFLYMGFQKSYPDSGELHRELQVRMMGGVFEIERQLDQTIVRFVEDGGREIKRIDWVQNNVPLPLEPLPGLDLTVQPPPNNNTGARFENARSVIIDASEFEPETISREVDDTRGMVGSQPQSTMEQLEDALVK